MIEMRPTFIIDSVTVDEKIWDSRTWLDPHFDSNSKSLKELCIYQGVLSNCQVSAGSDEKLWIDGRTDIRVVFLRSSLEG